MPMNPLIEDLTQNVNNGKFSNVNHVFNVTYVWIMIHYLQVRKSPSPVFRISKTHCPIFGLYPHKYWKVRYHPIQCVFRTVGDIMSTVGDVQYCVRISSFVIWVPWGTSWYMWRNIMSTVGYSNNKRCFPAVLMISLHVQHDILHGTEYFHGTQDNPHGTNDIPHGTEHPTVLKISPTFIMISLHDTEHRPRCWAKYAQWCNFSPVCA